MTNGRCKQMLYLYNWFAYPTQKTRWTETIVHLVLVTVVKVNDQMEARLDNKMFHALAALLKYTYLSTVHNMEKQTNSGLFNTDTATALISSTDTLLSTSPLPNDALLEPEQDSNALVDPFVNIDGVDGAQNTAEYTTPSKRIKTDA